MPARAKPPRHPSELDKSESVSLPPSAPGRPALAVCPAAQDDAVQQRAGILAAQLGLPLISTADPAFDIVLTVTADQLELRFPKPGAPGPMVVDFVGGPLGFARRVNRFGLLYQAVGFRHGRPSIVDATAGLGRDAFRLAYHGCRVTAVERSPILFALLRDGLDRALRDPEIAGKIGDRLQLFAGDARDLLRRLPAAERPDVVYIDPMFPARQKSALVKVEMRILRQLVGDDPDARELFELALPIARRRVVVKRHLHAPPIADDPTHSMGDKTTRYDVYVRSAADESSSAGSGESDST